MGTVFFVWLRISVIVSVFVDRSLVSARFKKFLPGNDFTMTSAEPSKTAAYSIDIGWRVVWQRIGMGLTYKEIAIRLQIAVSTAHRLFQRYESTGDVAPLNRAERHELRKLDNLHELFIIGLICENPAIYTCTFAKSVAKFLK